MYIYIYIYICKLYIYYIYVMLYYLFILPLVYVPFYAVLELLLSDLNLPTCNLSIITFS